MSAMTDAFLIEFVIPARRAELDRRLGSYLAALKAADKDGPSTDTMLDEDPVKKLQAEYTAFRDDGAVIPIRARALTRRELREVKAQFPPRVDGHEDDVKADRLAGLNLDAAEDEIVYRALVEPEFASRAAFDEWADAQPAGMFNTILVRVWQESTGSVIDPKSLPASQTQSSD